MKIHKRLQSLLDDILVLEAEIESSRSGIRVIRKEVERMVEKLNDDDEVETTEDETEVEDTSHDSESEDEFETDEDEKEVGIEEDK